MEAKSNTGQKTTGKMDFDIGLREWRSGEQILKNTLALHSLLEIYTCIIWLTFKNWKRLILAKVLLCLFAFKQLKFWRNGHIL